MYKITHELAPKRLIDLFQGTPSSYYYNMRGSSTKLFLPKPKTEYLKKSLSYRGAKLWNSLPDEARNKHSLASFNSCKQLYISRICKCIVMFVNSNVMHDHNLYQLIVFF